MLKIEYIWRDLLDLVIERRASEFTITELSKKYALSTSVVNHALIPLRGLNIVKINKTSSRVVDWERLLFFWATRRNLKKEIVYSTFANLPVYDREGLMPPEVIPTAYTAFRIKFNKIPSDYDHVYFYSNHVDKIAKTFPADVPKKLEEFINEMMLYDPAGRPGWEKADLVKRLSDIRQEAFGRKHTL